MSYLTVKEYAEKYSVSSSSLYRKIRKGEIAFEVRGGKKYILDDVSTDLFPIVNTPTSPTETDIKDIMEATAETEVDVILETPAKRVEKYDTLLDKEVEVLQQKIERLEENTLVINTLLDEKFQLGIKALIDVRSRDITLNKYLLSMGYSKKYRKIVKNRFYNLKDLEERVVEIGNNDYLLKFSKYSYEDLLMIL